MVFLNNSYQQHVFILHDDAYATKFEFNIPYKHQQAIKIMSSIFTRKINFQFPLHKISIPMIKCRN